MDITLGVFPTCRSQFAPKIGSQEETQNNWIQKIVLLIISADELMCETGWGQEDYKVQTWITGFWEAGASVNSSIKFETKVFGEVSKQIYPKLLTASNFCSKFLLN